MTEKQKIKTIKRINDRYKQIVNKFGEDSSEAERYRNAMSAASKGNLTDSGNLSHSKKAIKEISPKALTALENRETASEISKAQKRVAEAEGITEEEARDLWNEIEDLKKEDDAYYLSDAFASYGFYDNRTTTGRPSYNDIKEVLEAYKKVPEEEKKKIRRATKKRHFKEDQDKKQRASEKASRRTTSSSLRVEEGNPFTTGSVEDSLQ